jgi:secreted trypsin-like serine protease
MRQIVAITIILNLSLTSAIYNATFAEPKQFPYSVLVKRLHKFCTGAIISERHVITSAHCVMQSSDSVFVTVGAHKYSDDGEEIESRRFWIHENFTMPTAVHDIAIVELKKTLSFDEAIQKIEISTKADVELDADEGEITVAGWGFRSEWDRSDVLMYTRMKLLPLEECMQYKSYYIEALNENNICAVAVEGMPCE